ncbi:MAG: flagellar basal-body MS-ring/collar protein FliF, partial [Candidatus Desulfacyla sp.]
GTRRPIQLKSMTDGSINRFDEVQGSRVHIVMGSKSLFVEDEEAATASVILKLAPGKTLTKGQVQAIVHLVSSSVSGLKTENVTVVDNYGKMLAGSKDRSSEGPMNSDQLALQEKMEKGLESRVRTMLETALGPGKAIARISCALDFRQQEKTEERYHPDNKAIRSEQVLNESTGEGEGGARGVPGILSNVDSRSLDLIKSVYGSREFSLQRPLEIDVLDKLGHTQLGVVKDLKPYAAAERQALGRQFKPDFMELIAWHKDGIPVGRYLVWNLLLLEPGQDGPRILGGQIGV